MFLTPSISFFQDDFYVSQTPDFIGIAKSMLNGSVLYTDVADHKGIYLFFPFLLGQCITKTSTIPIYIMEQIIFLLIVLSGFNFFDHVYGSDMEKALNKTIKFTMFFIFCCWKQVSLLVTEGYLCIVLFWLFLYLFKLDNGHQIKESDFFIFGAIGSFFLFHKYSIVIYFIPLFCILLAEMIKRKTGISKIKKYILYLLVGFIFMSIIPIGYNIYHKNFMDMVEVMDNCFYSDLQLKSYIFSFVGIIFVVLVMHYHIKENIVARNFFLFLSIFLLNSITITYHNYILIPFVVIGFCCLSENQIFNGNNKGYIPTKIAVICIFLICSMLTITKICNELTYKLSGFPYPKAREYSERYDINNSNTLFLTEDIGIGAWGEESYKIKYQWIPSRFFASDVGYQLLKRNLELIKDKEFEFVVFYEKDLEGTEEKYIQIYEEMKSEISNYYYPVNRYGVVFRLKLEYRR